MLTTKQPKIIIVGAGIAGISAANRLVQAGFEDIVILEALDRIGGRIHTVSFGDGNYPVELGANWIHGPGIANSVFQVAESIGALQPYRLQTRWASRFMRENGTEISRDVVKDAVHIHSRVSNEVLHQLSFQRINHGKIITMAPLMYERLEEEIRKAKGDEAYKKDLRRVCASMVNYSRTYEGDELERVTWEKPPTEYNIPPGGDVHVAGGYVQILEHLMRIVPKGSLKLNTEVTQIGWSMKHGPEVEVAVKNGSKFKADHVIVTCSLGFLKKHHESLFHPCLPEKKVAAINSMAMGRVNKIFLEFDRPVLGPQYRNIAFAWDDMDTSLDSTKSDGEVRWYKGMFGFDQIFTKNNTLLGWVVGDGAEYMERLTDTEIAQTCVKLLRKFLNNPEFPEPINVLVSRWCSDPYAFGTYSYQTKKIVPGERTILSEPLTAPNGEPLVLFAGEAITNSCTHGARDTGINEAERLIKLYTEGNISSKPWKKYADRNFISRL